MNRSGKKDDEDRSGTKTNPKEEKIISRLARFGITIKGRALVRDQGIPWCKHLITILERKEQGGGDVQYLARWFAADPDRLVLDDEYHGDYDIDDCYDDDDDEDDDETCSWREVELANTGVVLDTLEKAAECSQRNNERRDVYMKRLMDATNKNDVYEKLPGYAKTWVAAALEADVAGEKIPDLEEQGVVLDPYAEFIEGR